MKKIFYTLVIGIFISVAFLIIILSTSGIKTDKFNKIISRKINESNNNIFINLETIKFKIDIKEISLFLETFNPEVNYRNTFIPAKSIKVYINFVSLMKSNLNIQKINLVLEELQIDQLKELSSTIKPSNFKSFLNNKIIAGKLNSELDIYLDENNLLENFIAKGKVSNLKTEIKKGTYLEKVNFNFFADRTDVLMQNINGIVDFIEIKDGDLKLDFSDEILLETNFKTNIKYNGQKSYYLDNIIQKDNYLKKVLKFEGGIKNNLQISFDKTYKVKKYKYSSNGNIFKGHVNFKKPIKNFISSDEIKTIELSDTNFSSIFNIKEKSFEMSGEYSYNNNDRLKFDLANKITDNLNNFLINFEYKNKIKIDIINYKKEDDAVANISLNFVKNKENYKFNNIKFSQGDDLILIDDLKLDKGKLLSFKKIMVETRKNKKKNNNFIITYNDFIRIKGSQFDATNLPKILNQTSNANALSKINKDLEIDFTNIIAPLSEKIENFKLIGRIEKGKFSKISSKGSFGGSNFLDITMKKDKESKKKYLEVYSDLTRPMLTEYSFFNGLTGGKLLFSSIIDGNNSSSKLMIENFKVINAPGMVKLLSLADLGGLADLAEGEGLSFDILEIKMEKSKKDLKLTEILALGPSMSVLMEGYQNPTVTSLRGTLVPAKTLNKMIAKIPVIGDIVIPKEVGEGLFGISFKMKGPPGQIKTTINPIRTITPRFIQKILEKKKKTK